MLALSASLQFTAFSQTSDTITLSNGDVLVGEIKELSKGIISIETVYSDADFTIEWDQVTRVKSEAYFLISLTNGTRLNGPVLPDPDNPGHAIVGEEGETRSVPLIEIVYLKSVKTNIWSRINKCDETSQRR